MMGFDCMYKISHEWSHYKYTLWFKNGELRRIDEYSKSTNIFIRVFYRNPNINEFGITTYILEEIVGYVCRGKEERNIKEFLEMFVSDEKYYNIIMILLEKEVRQMTESIVRINDALGN